MRFGSFELDLRAGELHKHGVKIKLQQQPFQVLALLLERPGDVVTREELKRAIWPSDTFVCFDEALDAAVYRLRQALSDSADNPRFIDTLPRRGYRFLASVDGIVSSTESEHTVRFAGGNARAADPSDSMTSGAVKLATSQNGGQELPAASSQSRLRYVLAVGGSSLALLAIVGVLVFHFRELKLLSKPTAHIQSIAVLPLENLSSDPAQQYFANGMTEALITDLGKIGALRVISRTSAMQYKDTHKTLAEIARELRVDAVLEGAVLRMGDEVRITTQLVDTATDRQLWAADYHENLRDVLTLQDEVARAIANEVQIKLSAQEQILLTSARPLDPAAYEAYLRGRYEWNQWSEEHLKKSVEYFEQALRKEPAYAPAWAGLSDAYSLFGLFDYLPQQVIVKQSKEAARRALELDGTLSEAHVSLGSVNLGEWAWTSAGKEFQQAIALDPNNSMAHQWYGYYLSAMGQFDEAIAEMKRALELDPLSSNKQNSLGATFYRARRYDEALQHFREVPDPDANSGRRHRWMAAIYERKGMQREAKDELVTALMFTDNKKLAESVERTYLSSGYAEAKKAFLSGDIRGKWWQTKNAYSPSLALELAADYASLGQKNKALEWLDTAVREHDALLGYLKVDDRFDILRSDPRFKNLVRRVGLPL